MASFCGAWINSEAGPGQSRQNEDARAPPAKKTIFHRLSITGLSLTVKAQKYDLKNGLLRGDVLGGIRFQLNVRAWPPEGAFPGRVVVVLFCSVVVVLLLCGVVLVLFCGLVVVLLFCAVVVVLSCVVVLAPDGEQALEEHVLLQQ